MPKLPPLNAARVFEVVARTGGFTQAAAELAVSATAVSQQIRNLETFFGKQLFVRSGNRIALTDAGHALYPQLAQALNDIAAAAARLQDTAIRTRLVISAPTSLADPWLVPRLPGLLERFPNTTIDLRVEDDPIDLGRRGVDLRISYGAYHYPGLEPVPLIHDAVVPLCAPSLKLTEDDVDGLDDSRFIHTNWGPNFASHPSWSDWFRITGRNRAPDPARGHRAGLSALALSLARQGLGVALGQRLLAQLDLAHGGLVELSQTTLRLGHPYCAFVPHGKERRADIQHLIALLKDEAGDGQAIAL